MFKNIKKFLSNNSGNIAITGGLLMVPIMTSVGAVVDYTNYVNQRSSVQQSLDAAGLATGRFMNSGANEAEIKAYAESFFKANLDKDIKDSSIDFSFQITPGDSSVDPAIPTTVNLSAEFTYDTHFSNVLPLDEIIADMTTAISLGNRTVEVALVMDNSGSMGSNNRINIMKTETKKLIDIVFNASEFTDLPDPVRFSIVPFGGSVNIGANNANRLWMDRRGWSSVHHENLDWNTYQTSNQTRYRRRSGDKFGFQENINGSWQWKTRLDVFEMLGEEWGGCVEMRPWPYNVLDVSARSNQGYNTVKNSLDTDGDGIGDGHDALFVPMFAPDEPYNRVNNQSGYDSYEPYYFTNSYIYEWEDSFDNPVYSNVNQNISTNNADDDGAGFSANGQVGNSNQINRTNWIFKYQGDRVNSNLHEWRGPNYSCSTNPIEQLTDDADYLKDKVDEMNANGSTNLQQGLTWGWRTLSEGEPFTEGRPSDDSQNMKFLIMLTDGNNFYSADYGNSPNRTRYGAWGYARPDGLLPHAMSIGSSNPNDPKWETHNRWAEGLESSDLQDTIYQTANFDLTPEDNSEFELIMNAHTNQACRNIKNDGISIFTIAFDVSNNSSVKNLLDACAGSGIENGQPVMAASKFYFDVSSSELDSAMNSIANQIADLRIAR